MKNVIERDYFPGGEWLYYKLYIGYASANTILLHYIQPLAENLLHQELIDRWFFVRYRDPDPHIRLRFHLKDIYCQDKIAFQFQDIMNALRGEIIWRIETATYSRELERYGHTTMKHTEILFYHDSEIILSLLANSSSDEYCFLFLLKMIDVRLDDFNFSLKEKTNLFNSLQLNFKKEFNSDSHLIKSLSLKYRKLYPKINSYMNPEKEDQLFLYELLEKNTLLTLPIINQIMDERKSGLMVSNLEDFLASLIHMNINRIFRSKQRVYEMVAYDFLYRYYNSKLIRKTKNNMV